MRSLDRIGPPFDLMPPTLPSDFLPLLPFLFFASYMTAPADAQQSL